MIFDGNFIPKSTGFVLEMKVVYCLESSQIGGNTPLFCFSALEHQRDDAVEELAFPASHFGKGVQLKPFAGFSGWES